MQTDVTGQVNTTSAPIGGHVVSTTRLPADIEIDERAQWIADKFGTEAAAVVVALSRELGTKLERSLELAQVGDPAFRKACERHLVALRKRRAEQLAEQKRQQQIDDCNHQRASLANRLSGTLVNLEALRLRRQVGLDYARVYSSSGAQVSRESLDAIDNEIAKLEKQLEQLSDEIEAFDAAQAGG